ncbi:MAG: hypothetical protein HC869_21550 [Rhodospirillales bacterium]|nr:hypothetical protein [Rhodospirillales bacterium]
MQTNILRSLALVAVGNAALAGRDVSAFWPSPLLRYYKQVEFLIAHGNDKYTPVAPDPLAWFAKLRGLRCQGLRLHNAPMDQREGLPAQKERMLVGMVGGGPRWLIEAVYPSRAEVWEAFDRLGDRNDPEQKIWLCAYLMLGEIENQDGADRNVAAAHEEVAAALKDIEALARDIPGAPFAEDFAGARAVLNGTDSTYPSLEFLELTDLDQPARRLLAASAQAWVFGAMGSWNDIGVADALKQRYERTSDALFKALQRAVIAVANASFRG